MTPETTAASVVEGERRRDAGMALAARRRRRLVVVGRLDFLDAVRAAPARTATTDDIAEADPFAAYADGGKWRGTIVKSLARDGIIRRVGYRHSTCAARHAGLVAEWQAAVSDAELNAHRTRLRRQLDALIAAESPAASTDQRSLF